MIIALLKILGESSMRWKFTHSGLIALGLLVHAASNAATYVPPSNNSPTLLSAVDDEPKPRSLESRVAALEQKRGGMLNPPARPIVEDYDFNFFGDLLVWQAHENGLPVAIKNKATNFTSVSGYQNLQHAKVKHLDFNYDPGFRIGVNFDTMYDGWDVCLTWLRFNADAHAKAHAHGNKELFPSRLASIIGPFIANSDVSLLIPFPAYGKMHAHWHAYLNQLDLDLGREFYVSKYLTLRPHFGLRTTWLRQRLKTHYSDGIAVDLHPVMPNTDVREKNKWWGLGVEGGLDTRWLLGCGISIYGDLAAAIEYGFQKVRIKQEVESTVELTFENVKDSIRISRPILDLQLGLAWDHGFAHDSYNFGVHAGWEHHVYFSQNQFHALESFGQFASNQGDLTYQGWTLGAHLAF
jgi:hypothetical protein